MLPLCSHRFVMIGQYKKGSRKRGKRMIVEFEGNSYTLDVEEIDVRQAMVIKVKTGYNLLQWQAALEQADVDAIKALYWLMLAQNGTAADIDLINFKVLKFAQAVKAAQKSGVDESENPTSPAQTTG
jgi:hypothetical protein